jgi:alkaline phosphatase D
VTKQPAQLALTLCLLGILVGAPSAWAAPVGFEFGVASGDVSSDSAMLWARANRAGTALLQVSASGRFGACDIAAAPKKMKVKALKGNDFTVQAKVSGLKPGRTYQYRWCMAGRRHSAVGRFDTAPAPSQAKTIRFAFTGDQDAAPKPGTSSPFWGTFGIWNQVNREHNDFNVLMGNAIYADSEVPGAGGPAKSALTVAQKFAKYRQNLAQKPWDQIRGATSYYAHWDDHDFINDFAPSETSFSTSSGGRSPFSEDRDDLKYDGRKLYADSVKAFTAYNPVTYSARNGIYRSFQWGKNLQVFFLDERSFRTANADYDSACDNPPGSTPDLAPTAPAAIRTAFSQLIPALASPLPPSCLAALDDPRRTMLGEHQLAIFEQAIKRSKATFKVIMNSVPIQQFYANPYDRWEGYPVERTKLLTFLRDNVKNVVFLTTDIHADMVNTVRLQTFEAGGPIDTGMTEVTSGPIATKTFAAEAGGATGDPAASIPIRQVLFDAPPQAGGVGMQCSDLDQLSYGEVSVTKSALTVNLKDIDGKPVLNTPDRTKPAPPCPPIVIPAR